MKIDISVTQRPFKYLVPSLRTKAFVILIFLLPQLIMLALSESYSSLIVIFTCVASSIFADCARFLLQKKRDSFNIFSITYALIRGILTGFFIPASYPIFAVFLIVFFTIFLCGIFLEGFAESWLNPVAVTVAVCWIAGTKVFPSWQITSEILLTRNPSLALIHNGTFSVFDFDSAVTSFLNKNIFSIFDVAIPEGYVSLLWDTQSEIPAFRFNFITIITSVIFISFDIIKPAVPAVFVIVYGILVYAASPLFFGGVPFRGDIILAFFTSGIIFSSLFLLQWPSTTPFTDLGKFIYAVIAGFSAFMIAGAGTSSVGAIFCVLFVNIISIIIQAVEQYAEKKQTLSTLAKKVTALKEGSDA